MNNTPPSADLSKLKNILGSAKAIINKTNNVTPNQGNNRGTSRQTQDRDGYGPGNDIKYLSEADMMQNQNQGVQQYNMGDATRQPGEITEEAIRNSKLPEAVKKAMLENKIPKATINHTFNLDDVSDLIEQRPTPQPQVRQQVNENAIIKNPNDTFTVSESALRGIIKDVLVEYLAVDYTKNLTEATIKKTINTLIKEGKIKTKPKV